MTSNLKYDKSYKITRFFLIQFCIRIYQLLSQSIHTRDRITDELASAMVDDSNNKTSNAVSLPIDVTKTSNSVSESPVCYRYYIITKFYLAVDICWNYHSKYDSYRYLILRTELIRDCIGHFL